jgi:hypothetical protein
VHRSILTCAISLAAVVRPVDGQSPPRRSVDVTIGTGYGRGGGERLNRHALAADVVGAARLRPAGGGALQVGASAWLQGGSGADAVCFPARAGGCVPDYPDFAAVAALAGWEAGRRRGPSFRVLVGPGFFGADGHGALGAQGRLDAAAPAWGRVAGVLGVRGALVPRLGGEPYALGAASLGIRLQ